MKATTQQPTSSTLTVKIGCSQAPQKKSIEIGGSSSFTVIAGPCSIESYDQFKETALSVQASGAAMLRGGIWKLRTSPGTFQGLGSEASGFIKEVLSQAQMPLVSEVTDPRHIEAVYDYVDMFQVGSRNMHNYALLKELGKQNKPVLLKRGFAALISEWIKASEYITNSGNQNVILCERGIRTFETATRNTLDLNAVVYAKKHSPLPVIVDPSHAVGIRDLVAPLCYAAAAAGADGLIIEVHPNPAVALSDGEQALTLLDFETMMKQLEKVLFAFDKKLQRNL